MTTKGDILPEILKPMLNRPFPELTQGKIWGVMEYEEWKKDNKTESFLVSSFKYTMEGL
jgi:hypothetical protein